MIHAQNMKYLNLTPPGALVDDASLTVAEIDTKGWDYCQILLILGTTNTDMTALAVTESDVTASGHVAVTGLEFTETDSPDIEGDASVYPVATDDDGIFLFEIDLRGRKRFLDVTATVGSTSTGGYYTMLAILSRGENVANTNAARGVVQALRV